MEERVSVVIPAYNVSKYIDAAIESVLGQTYGGAEIVVVDDCSRDDTAEKASRYGDRVKVVRHPENRGAAQARNTGLEHSSGEIVAFLDGDDLWAPGKLQAFVEALSGRPDILFAFSDFSRFEWEDGSYFALSNSQIYPAIYRAIEGMRYRGRKSFVIPKRVAFSLILEGYPVYPSAIVLRRKLFERIGLWKKIRTNEDFDLGLRSCRVTDFLYIDEPLAMIGRHDSNLTLDISKQMEGNISVIDSHLADPGYGAEERERILFNKGRRLCGLGYGYLHAGDRDKALGKYSEALRMKGWFWHSLIRILYILLGGGGKRAGTGEGNV